MSTQWRYYNFGALPLTAPNETVDTSAIENGSIWNINGKKPLLVRWTSNFDCSDNELWWFTIKDDVFDISKLNSKRRYEINKGLKYFDIRKIDAVNCWENILEIQKKAFLAYPKKYRDKVNETTVKKEILEWKNCTTYAAFYKETQEMCGYSVLEDKDTYYNFMAQKTIPEFEKYAINAALVYFMLVDKEKEISSGKFICDGERNTNHETNFQDYLIKYFMFRKAFCHLHVAYRREIKPFVYVMKKFDKFLRIFDFIPKIHLVNAVLEMQKIVDSQEKYDEQ